MTSPVASLRGALRPRVEHRPEGMVETLGPQMSLLAEMAGLPPDPWQRDGHEIMMSLRSDGQWAAKDYAEWVGRQQGKSGGLGVPRLLAGLFLLPERLFLWSAHLATTSTEAFEMVKEALLTLGNEIKPELIEIPALDMPDALQEPLYVQIISANGKEGLRTWTADRRRDWRKRLLMVSRSKGGGRGLPADVRIVDEAFAYTPPQQAALAPTRLAKPFSQTVHLSSPPLNGAEGQVMYRLRERAEVERDPRLGYRDWGLKTTLDEFLRLSPIDQKAFLRNRDHWVATLPALGLGRVTEESVEGLINEFAEFADAAREILGCWPVQAASGPMWQVIAEDDWLARAGGDRDLWTDEVAFAVASPVEQDWTAIAVAGWSTDGEILVQVVDYFRGTAGAEEKILGLVERHPGALVALDPRGPAGHLRKPLEDADVELLEPTALDGAHAAQQFVRNIVDVPTVRHFGQDSLDISVKAAVKRTQGDGWRWERRAGTDISPLDAASLAVWAVQDAGPALEPVSVGVGSADLATDDLSRIGF